MMAVSSRTPDVVCLSNEMDDWGVYAKGGYVNDFKTPLIARGTKEAVDALLAEVSA